MKPTVLLTTHKVDRTSHAAMIIHLETPNLAIPRTKDAKIQHDRLDRQNGRSV
jgi:hypothetical protein